jgi:hypothetical protein
MGTPSVREAPTPYAAGEWRHAWVRGGSGPPITGDRAVAQNDPPGMCEATLAELWTGQRFPASALVTRQGVPVRVLHPGRRGRGAGPDFRNALIATPSGRILQGDVELHVRAGDFQAHGHQRDPRYDGVVLHVVFEDDEAEDTRLASGRRAPVVALAPWLQRRARQLATWLEGPALWREPCHDAVARLGRDRVVQTLETLGDARFREREAALVDDLRARGPGEALYRALVASLGYGGDRGLSVGLAEGMPWRDLSAELASMQQKEKDILAEALLLGAAELLPSQVGAEPGHPREGRWEEHWRHHEPMAKAPRRRTGAGTTGSLRPANHPARRLAGLAELLVRHGPCFEDGAPAREALEGRPSQLIKAWTVPAQGYWREHLAPGVTARRTPGALVGRGRAIELLVNAVLPWAAAQAEAGGEPDRAARARASFAGLPGPGRYGALAFLEANLGTGGESLALGARRQQGLLALYKAECTSGGCGRCPLS